MRWDLLPFKFFQDWQKDKSNCPQKKNCSPTVHLKLFPRNILELKARSRKEEIYLHKTGSRLTAMQSIMHHLRNKMPNSEKDLSSVSTCLKSCEPVVNLCHSWGNTSKAMKNRHSGSGVPYTKQNTLETLLQPISSAQLQVLASILFGNKSTSLANKTKKLKS